VKITLVTRSMRMVQQSGSGSGSGSGSALLAIAAALAVVSASGCVEVPRAPSPVDVPLDGSLLSQDGGARRPATAEGPPVSGCWPESGGGGAGEPLAPGTVGDGGILDGTASPSGATGATTAPRAPRAVSEIVITELMSDPALVADGDGEWIELHNPSDAVLDLAGCELDDGGTRKMLADSLLVPKGGFVTLARSAAAGFVPDRTLSFTLANMADAIGLECQGVVVDRVVYGAGFPLAAGVSMALDPSAFDATRNDDASAWCLSPTTTYAEQGTPGEANAPCHGDADAGR
jgi:hypothetical protein